jgi:hypothetical protein
VNGAQVDFTWTDGTPVADPATLGNPANEIGFRIERADIDTYGNVGAYLPIGSALANATTFSDTTFNPLLAYYYKVVVFNAAGDTASNAVRAGPLNPAAPSDLTAALQAGPQVGLIWIDNATNETGFVVQRSDNGGPFATIATPAANTNTGTVTYADNTAQPGNTYAYKVSAMNGFYTSTFSNTATVTMPVSPVAPTSLVASLLAAYGTAPQIALTFRDNATNETGFLVERAVNGGFFTALVTLPARKNTGNVTYTDTVTAGNTYAYRVRAVNVVVPSAYSNTVSLAVPAAPAAPLNFTATTVATSATRARVDLSWIDNSNNETRFIIQQSTSAAFTTATTFTVTRNTAESNASGGTVRLSLTGLLRATTYYYRILARNLYGDSVWVNLTAAPVLGAVVNRAQVDLAWTPAAPTNLASSLRAKEGTAPYITLTFKDRSTNETGFVVERAVNGGDFASLITLAPRNRTGKGVLQRLCGGDW